MENRIRVPKENECEKEDGKGSLSGGLDLRIPDPLTN